jgi:hypothetical protein
VLLAHQVALQRIRQTFASEIRLSFLNAPLHDVQVNLSTSAGADVNDQTRMAHANLIEYSVQPKRVADLGGSVPCDARVLSLLVSAIVVLKKDHAVLPSVATRLDPERIDLPASDGVCQKVHCVLSSLWDA